MAVFRARAVAVAAGVPAAFARARRACSRSRPRSPRPPPAERGAGGARGRRRVRRSPAAGTWSVTRGLVRAAFAPMAVSGRRAVRGPGRLHHHRRRRHQGHAAACASSRRTELPVTAFVSAWTVKDRAGTSSAITAMGQHPEPLRHACQPGAVGDGPRPRDLLRPAGARPRPSARGRGCCGRRTAPGRDRHGDPGDRSALRHQRARDVGRGGRGRTPDRGRQPACGPGPSSCCTSPRGLEKDLRAAREGASARPGCGRPSLAEYLPAVTRRPVRACAA